MNKPKYNFHNNQTDPFSVKFSPLENNLRLFILKMFFSFNLNLMFFSKEKYLTFLNSTQKLISILN